MPFSDLRHRFQLTALLSGVLLLNGCALLVRFPAYPVPQETAPSVFRGVYHVHTNYSHDSKASLAKVIRTARKAGLDFVVITDHNTLAGAKAYQQMKADVLPLLIFGDEISAPDGHLTAIGIVQHPAPGQSSQEFVDEIHRQGGYAVIAHPTSRKKPWRNWQVKRVNGLEIYDFGHVFYSENKLWVAAKVLFFPPAFFLKSFQKKSFSGLDLWREQLQGGPVAAFAAVDAHIHWQWWGLTPENYLLAFQSVTMYALANELTPVKITEALGRGRSFIAFETWGIARNFSFLAHTNNENFGSGEKMTAESLITFSVKVPAVGEIRFFHNGKMAKQAVGSELITEAKGAGAYHVEIYRKGELWILANPIYVES